MDHCLRTDIYDTGKMCWMNCVCSGPDLISCPNKNACFMSPIQDELLPVLHPNERFQKKEEERDGYQCLSHILSVLSDG